MCTLCLSDMGELRDEWLRPPAVAAAAPVAAGPPASFARTEPRPPPHPRPEPRRPALVAQRAEAAHA